MFWAVIDEMRKTHIIMARKLTMEKKRESNKHSTAEAFNI